MRQILYTIILYAISTTTIIAQSVCVGTPGQITWKEYRGLYDDEVAELLSWPIFPDHPYETKILYNTKSVVDYDNAMGAIMQGFIYVPQSDSVTFNLTGNEQARFYLSTDSLPDHKVLRASLIANTGAEEYTKYPTQTSVKLYLQAGVNYYFEILYVDGSGSDFANLYWKTTLVDPVNWKPISAGFLKNVGCEPMPCPKAGTPCDDGIISTIDDVEDGQCHCTGKSPSTNACIGQRGVLENYRYDNITGSELNDLYNNPNFPAMPSFTEVMPLLGKANATLTNYGRLTHAFLKVPVSGLYKFNVTGDDQTVLYISSDDDPDNKQAHQCLVSGFTSPTQHEKYQWQSTSFIFLDANQYYYIELNSKQSTGSGHFGVFWQTPFGQPGIWKRPDAVYLYNYDCTLACMPQGALCDDGNIFTNNDLYNANCQCLGTPCVGAGCNSPLAYYVPFDKCAVSNDIDNLPQNNWLSCAPSANPNAQRQSGHWIKYDLGQEHRLLTSQIWNYNVANETSKGFQQVAIDYSNNGTTWTEYGVYNWPLASGDGQYGGFNGPDFQGISAKYILITSLDDPSSCRGLGKVAFKAIYCPPQGTACNDYNILTTDDKYDGDCHCEGIPLEMNLCVDPVLVLGSNILYPTNYSAIHHVQSISEVQANNRTSFVGGEYIELNPGFNSQEGAVFIAAIDTCNTTTAIGARIARKLANKPVLRQKDIPAKYLQVLPRDNSDEINVLLYLERSGQVRLSIYDLQHKELYNLVNHDYKNKGHYTKIFRTKKLLPGTYQVVMQTDNKSYTEDLHVK